MRMIFRTATAACAALVAACGGDSPGSSVLEVSQVHQTSGTGGTDSTSSPSPTSTGPVASVVVTPKQVSLPKGYYLTLTAQAFDAKGVRVTGKLAAWRSSDPSVVIASDTGLVYGKGLGSAKVYGTIDGRVDSAAVTVIDAPTPQPIPTPAPAVARFDLGITVSGALSRTDSGKVERVAGATVRLTQVGGINGDTLSTAISAGQGTTDADGRVSFTSLPGGFYTVEIIPPAGSPYQPLRSGFGRPTTTDVHLIYTLFR